MKNNCEIVKIMLDTYSYYLIYYEYGIKRRIKKDGLKEMFRVECESKKVEKEINQHLAWTLDEDYFEGQEIHAENAIQDYLFDNQLYYFAVDIFWNDRIIGVTAIEN